MKPDRIIVAFFFSALFVFISVISFSQARLVLGNTSAVYMVMNGGTSGTPIYLVIGDPATAANPNTITRNSTAGIISEGQYNYVKWYVGNGTSLNYLIPWIDNAAGFEDVSVRFDITSAGNAGGFFLAATYDGTWDNATYMPAPVTNMGSSVTNLANASQYVLDRFWGLIDEASYSTTKPALGNLIFTYPDNEHTPASNTIIESNFQAQRWNTSVGDWQGYLWINGTVNTSANTVTVSSVTAADMFRWWVLVDNQSPLPVEFLSFDASCSSGNVLVKWSTAAEFNSSHFIVERSADGNTFASIGTVPASGNSATVKNYSFTDTDPLGTTAFYRITEVDLNANMQPTNAIAVSPCGEDNIAVFSSGGDIYVNIVASAEGKYQIALHNALGQNIAKELRGVIKGQNTIKLMPELATGVYFVTVKNSSYTITKKVFVRSGY